jgi:hypothetical protein
MKKIKMYDDREIISKHRTVGHLSGSHLLSEQVHLEGKRAPTGSFRHLEQSSH